MAPSRGVLSEDGVPGHTHDESFFLSSNCFSTARDRTWRKPSMVTVGAWKTQGIVAVLALKVGWPGSTRLQGTSTLRWQGGPGRELSTHQ